MFNFISTVWSGAEYEWKQYISFSKQTDTECSLLTAIQDTLTKSSTVYFDSKHVCIEGERPSKVLDLSRYTVFPHSYKLLTSHYLQQKQNWMLL